MKLKTGGTELELKYTFNSFKYMEDLDLEELSELDSKPFKMIGIAETLLLGALNHDIKDNYTIIEVSNIMEEVMENGDMFKLLEDLIELLQESSFFKNLQGEKPKKKK